MDYLQINDPAFDPSTKYLVSAHPSPFAALVVQWEGVLLEIRMSWGRIFLSLNSCIGDFNIDTVVATLPGA